MSRSPSLYRKVAEDIKAAIAAGGYAAGTRLPSESELAERYLVSRGTIRQAFAALRADGVIASRRGARRVVIGGPRVQSFGELLSFSRWARAMGEAPGGRVVTLQRGPAKPLEAERLAIPPGAPIYWLVRVRLLSGRPVMVERGAYPDRVGELVAGMDLETGSITERLEELGIVFADAEHVIDAVPGLGRGRQAARREPAGAHAARAPPHHGPGRGAGRVVRRPLPGQRRRVQRAQLDRGQRAVPDARGLSRRPAPRVAARSARTAAGRRPGPWPGRPSGVPPPRPGACGSASNAAASAAVIGPPCRDSVRTDSADSNPK